MVDSTDFIYFFSKMMDFWSLEISVFPDQIFLLQFYICMKYFFSLAAFFSSDELNSWIQFSVFSKSLSYFITSDSNALTLTVCRFIQFPRVIGRCTLIFHQVFVLFYLCFHLLVNLGQAIQSVIVVIHCRYIQILQYNTMQQQPKPQEPEEKSENDKIKQLYQTSYQFTVPPFNNGESMGIYSQRLEEGILTHLKFYENFGELIPLQQPSVNTSQQLISNDIKIQLKMTAYKIFSQMIGTFKVLAGEMKEKNQAQVPRVVEKIHKFFQICGQIRKIQHRETICSYLEQETAQMRKETQQINATVDGMLEEAQQFVVDQRSHENSVEGNMDIEIEDFMGQSLSN